MSDSLEGSRIPGFYNLGLDERLAEVIRRAETQEDVFRRDIVPDRLRRAAITTAGEAAAA